MSVADHVAAVHRHGLAPDVVLVDEASVLDGHDPGTRVVRAPLAAAGRERHDPAALGRAVSELVPTRRA